MDNWHTAGCKKPDITVVPGLGIPACMSCGETCPPHNVDSKYNDELEIPSAGKRSAMQLNWPLSVPYQDYAYRNDPDGLLHQALISQVDQRWCDEEPDQRMLCSYITNSSQPPASQGSKTTYEPLDGTKIRVLRLYKGSFGNYLNGEFETVSLQSENAEHEVAKMVVSNGKNKPASYEAVSYTWAKGNSKREKDHVIFIGPRWDTLPITENCFDALQNCRLEGKDRCLWIDAICINQSDISERTHQVGMMREIYSAASRVLIYLGIDDTESCSEITYDPEVLSRNPYFSRIWVVQEIASAKQALVLHARQSMGWSFFHQNLQWLPDKKWMRHFGSPRQIDDVHGFLTLLEDTADCNASDPRDKIFALLGLWKGHIHPDYALSTQAVYTGLASSFVTNEGQDVAGRLLQMASHDRSMPGLPSWVPDWSIKRQQPYRRQNNSSYRLPMLSPSKDGRFRVHGRTGSLCVLAAEMDIVAPYFSCGFLPTINGMVTATAGRTQVSLPPELLHKCELNDRIFLLSQYNLPLILRKKAYPDIYTFVGLCEYSVLSIRPTIELDAIRYLQDWAWLLSLHAKRSWSDVVNWEKLNDCWLALREQRKAERRTFLQRLIRKAHFLKKAQGLVQDSWHVLSNYSSNKRRMQASFPRRWTRVDSDRTRIWSFFERRWVRIYNRWQQADNLLVFHQRERRSLIRALLPGYRSLEPLEDSSAQPALEQSMWLPVSLHWFESSRHDPEYVYTQYPLVAACASRNIPLPPLHLVNDFKRHIVLSLGRELETGLRQLQRLEREQREKSLHDLSPHDSSLVSYNLERYRTAYPFTLRWETFLRWLSKPMSPSYDLLRYASRKHIPLIWDEYLPQDQLNKAHSWLDTNFDHYMKALSCSSGNEFSLDQFFTLIYREQLELLWQFTFYNKDEFGSPYDKTNRCTTGAELARAFFWRFDRSIGKACQLIGIRRLTYDQTKQQWTRFLKSLTQRSFEEKASGIPSEEFNNQPRSLDENTDSDQYEGPFLKTIKYDGYFIRPEESNCREGFKRAKSYSGPQSLPCNGEAQLSELIHSEIKRRRLAERVFAFLYSDTRAAQQSRTFDIDHLEDVLANDQLPNCSEPMIKEWRQENESWKVVEEYILESERHMKSLKFELLGEWKQDENVYKEIVII